jgi:hypothetical protein
MFVNDEQGRQIPCIPFSAKNKMPVKQRNAGGSVAYLTAPATTVFWSHTQLLLHFYQVNLPSNLPTQTWGGRAEEEDDDGTEDEVTGKDRDAAADAAIGMGGTGGPPLTW